MEVKILYLFSERMIRYDTKRIFHGTIFHSLSPCVFDSYSTWTGHFFFDYPLECVLINKFCRTLSSMTLLHCSISAKRVACATLCFRADFSAACVFCTRIGRDTIRETRRVDIRWIRIHNAAFIWRSRNAWKETILICDFDWLICLLFHPCWSAWRSIC